MRAIAQIASHDPLFPASPPMPERWELATSPSRQVLAARQPLIIPDAQTDEAYPGFRRDALARDYRIVVLFSMGALVAQGFALASPARVGQLVLLNSVFDRSPEKRAAIKARVKDALAGGKRPEARPRGRYYEPTILACPSLDVTSAREELFGPVLSAVRFDDEDQAIRLANDTRFGLAAGIFTRDSARGLRVMRRLRAGIVWINTYRAVSPVAPFGGYKSSVYGREGGHESLLDYTRVKTVWINTSTQPMGDPFVMR